jgi:hypothetical protein
MQQTILEACLRRNKARISKAAVHYCYPAPVLETFHVSRWTIPTKRCLIAKEQQHSDVQSDQDES